MKLIKSTIVNYIYHENSTLYIVVPENYNKFLIGSSERVKFYTRGLDCKKHKLNSNNSKFYKLESLKNKIDNYKIGGSFRDNWSKQHHEFLYKNLKNLNIDNNRGFIINHLDLRYNLNEPTFVKSRSIKKKGYSVILPLENLYLPYFMFPKIKNDIQFKEKKNSIVWRGSNSGYKTNSARRITLVKNFYNNLDFDIGFCDMRYKTDKFNKEYIKKYLSISDQLKFKFILSVEGNDFATNFSWIMLSNSIPICPIHVVETWFMESKLIPFQHFIPVKNDFSDLIDVYQNALKNEKLCQEILFKKKLFCANFLNEDRENNIIKDSITTYFKYCY